LGTFLVVCIVLSLLSSLMMAAFRAKGRSVVVDRERARARLTQQEFSGVVTSQQRMAHGFDAGYSCVIKIRCDDGSTVVIDASTMYENKYPVGSRVVKRAGEGMPSIEAYPDRDQPPDGSAAG
jgi:hypothetical protein